MYFRAGPLLCSFLAFVLMAQSAFAAEANPNREPLEQVADEVEAIYGQCSDDYSGLFFIAKAFGGYASLIMGAYLSDKAARIAGPVLTPLLHLQHGLKKLGWALSKRSQKRARNQFTRKLTRVLEKRGFRVEIETKAGQRLSSGVADCEAMLSNRQRIRIQLPEETLEFEEALEKETGGL